MMMTCRLLCALLVLALCCCPSVCVSEESLASSQTTTTTTTTKPPTTTTTTTTKPPTTTTTTTTQAPSMIHSQHYDYRGASVSPPGTSRLREIDGSLSSSVGVFPAGACCIRAGVRTVG
ncbi:mucin TcMUCI [Trypanosoma cruzi cruzi]|nr:mucin TcMUCI [Trypanosoma cruzi cruzi]